MAEMTKDMYGAIVYSYKASEIDMESDFYLNNADGDGR